MKVIFVNLFLGNSYNFILFFFDLDKYYLMYEYEWVFIVVCEKEFSFIIVFVFSCKEYWNVLEELFKVI